MENYGSGTPKVVYLKPRCLVSSGDVHWSPKRLREPRKSRTRLNREDTVNGHEQDFVNRRVRGTETEKGEMETPGEVRDTETVEDSRTTVSRSVIPILLLDTFQGRDLWEVRSSVRVCV